jgi:hypothetical protein
MGLLDDAIREHLDLKRRRGADPSEVAREEKEALGPVRREAPADEDVELYDEPEDSGGSYADHEPAGLDEPAAFYDDEPGSVSLSRYEEEQAAPEEPPAAPDRPVPSEPPSTHDAPYPEREEESATPPHGDPLAHQHTREFSATELGDALGHDEEGRDEDVVPADDEAEDELQDTPDFLQETPEHDRLWFEQKPPKDFDF